MWPWGWIIFQTTIWRHYDPVYGCEMRPVQLDPCWKYISPCLTATMLNRVCVPVALRELIIIEKVRECDWLARLLFTCTSKSGWKCNDDRRRLVKVQQQELWLRIFTQLLMLECDVLLFVYSFIDAALRFLDRIAEELELPLKKIEVCDIDGYIQRAVVYMIQWT